MPLTIRQIERWTKRVTHYRSTDVRVVNIQRGRRKKTGRPVIRATTFTTHNDDGTIRRNANKYKTVVEGIQKYSGGSYRPVSSGYVKVMCTCDYFWAYGCEVELHKRGAADIKFSNGKDPIIRNPKGRPWACKHLLALFDEIIMKGW